MSKEYNTAARPFRVWDFNTKTWAGDGVDLYLTANGTVVIPMKDEDSDFRVENIAVQQFTGRLDTKGIYIFEGAYVSADYVGKSEDTIRMIRGYVQYDPYYCFYYVDEEVEAGDGEERYLFRDLRNITVLGNMFEEEALKKKI